MTNCPYIHKRSDEDLDSIETSSSPRRKFKLYYNSRKDSREDVQKKIDDAVFYNDYGIDEMMKRDAYYTSQQAAKGEPAKPVYKKVVKNLEREVEEERRRAEQEF